MAAAARKQAAENIIKNKKDFRMIKSFAKPPPVICKVFKGVGILLGEEADHLNEWGYIKSMIEGRPGGEEPLHERIQSFEPMDECSRESIKTAKDALEDVTKDAICNVSCIGMHMFLWCQAVIQEWEESNKE